MPFASPSDSSEKRRKQLVSQGLTYHHLIDSIHNIVHLVSRYETVVVHVVKSKCPYKLCATTKLKNVFLFLVVRVEMKENSEREKNQHREAQRAGESCFGFETCFSRFSPLDCQSRWTKKAETRNRKTLKIIISRSKIL